jgi:hypothetical protein
MVVTLVVLLSMMWLAPLVAWAIGRSVSLEYFLLVYPIMTIAVVMQIVHLSRRIKDPDSE